jgi:pyruvate dehydrogenase E2 component (dihydrolipoamide acetyltransferase)
MLRIIIAAAAAVAIGTVGGLTLVAAKPARDAAPQVQLATATAEIAAPSPRKADPAPVSAPKRVAEAAPAPAAPKAQPAPAKAAPVEATPDKPEIRFDGDKVSVRIGKFKIDF